MPCAVVLNGLCESEEPLHNVQFKLLVYGWDYTYSLCLLVHFIQSEKFKICGLIFFFVWFWGFCLFWCLFVLICVWFWGFLVWFWDWFCFPKRFMEPQLQQLYDFAGSELVDAFMDY